MEKSPSIIHLANALKMFHANVGKITKDATNPFFNSKYATLSSILNAIKDPLHQAGLSFTQFPTGQNGLTTVLMHCESGEYMQCDYFMQPIKNDPQAQGSVISYMRRYALAAVLGLNLDEDDDANHATHGAGTPKEATAQPRQPLEKPWLDRNSKKYDLVVERLKNKTTTLSQVSQYFKLNKEIRAELQAIINGEVTSNEEGITGSIVENNILNTWKTTLAGIKSVAALNAYYRENENIIKAHPRIVNLFTERKKVLEEEEKKSAGSNG